MGKKKDKKASKAEKAKLPKEVAGVKIPKALRDHGQQLADLARNPLVAEVAAAGLVAVAAALRDGTRTRAAAKATVAKVENEGAEAAKDVKAGLADLANIALAAAAQGVQAFANAARDKADKPVKPH